MVATVLRMVADDLPYIPLYRRTLNWAMARRCSAVQWPNDTIELRWVCAGPGTQSVALAGADAGLGLVRPVAVPAEPTRRSRPNDLNLHRPHRLHLPPATHYTGAAMNGCQTIRCAAAPTRDGSRAIERAISGIRGNTIRGTVIRIPR
jgi:hypothetical protein